MLLDFTSYLELRNIFVASLSIKYFWLHKVTTIILESPFSKTAEMQTFPSYRDVLVTEKNVKPAI